MGGKKHEGKSVIGKSVRGESMTGKCTRGKSARGEKCGCLHEPHFIEATRLPKILSPLERINISRIWILPAGVLRPGFGKGKSNLLYLLG